MTPVSLLYWGHIRNKLTKTQPHAHSFWQLEINIVGNTKFETSGGVFSLQPGESIIIPPEITHKLTHKDWRNRESYTFKFKTAKHILNCSPKMIEANSTAEVLCKLIISLLSGKNVLPENRQRTIPYLLTAIIHEQYLRKPQNIPETEIIRKIREYVCIYGKKANVEIIAKKQGVSRKHINNMTNKYLGISAKSFIDNECLRIAKEHLEFSDFRINEIAEIMNFTDIYAFSRFFKRLSGLNPSTFRHGDQ